MPEPTLLIVGPPSQFRDNCELSVRRHQSDVVICENCRRARAVLDSAAVRAVIVLPAADDRAVDEFLESVRGEHPHLPVFFVGSASDESCLRQSLRHCTVVLPTGMPASQFEQVLFPAPLRPARVSDETPGEVQAILLERREYPLHFTAARALFEAEFLTRVLKRERGNVSRTARAIGMARRNLQIKIRAHRIDIAHIRHRT